MGLSAFNRARERQAAEAAAKAKPADGGQAAKDVTKAAAAPAKGAKDARNA